MPLGDTDYSRFFTLYKEGFKVAYVFIDRENTGSVKAANTSVSGYPKFAGYYDVAFGSEFY